MLSSFAPKHGETCEHKGVLYPCKSPRTLGVGRCSNFIAAFASTGSRASAVGREQVARCTSRLRAVRAVSTRAAAQMLQIHSRLFRRVMPTAGRRPQIGRGCRTGAIRSGHLPIRQRFDLLVANAVSKAGARVDKVEASVRDLAGTDGASRVAVRHDHCAVKSIWLIERVGLGRSDSNPRKR